MGSRSTTPRGEPDAGTSGGTGPIHSTVRAATSVRGARSRITDRFRTSVAATPGRRRWRSRRWCGPLGCAGTAACSRWGAGAGSRCRRLLRLLRPKRLTGLDIDGALLEQARSRTEGLGIELLEGDVRVLPFPEASFDLVVDFGTCYHVSRRAQALREIARVLAVGWTLRLRDAPKPAAGASRALAGDERSRGTPCPSSFPTGTRCFGPAASRLDSADARYFLSLPLVELVDLLSVAEASPRRVDFERVGRALVCAAAVLLDGVLVAGRPRRPWTCARSR